MSESQAKNARRELRRAVGDDALATMHRHGGQLTTLGMLLDQQRQDALAGKVELAQLQKDFGYMRVHLDTVEHAQRTFTRQTLWQRVRWICGLN